MAALMSCTNLCVFCCVSRSFAFGGRSVTLLMDHGTMSHGLMFGHVCALCCQKRSTITGCGECQEHCCDECIEAHNWEKDCLLADTRVTHIDVEFSYFDFCGVLCREGLRSTLGRLGGLF